MKLAIITGGSKGLGKSLVEVLTENGWQVRELSRSGTGPSHISLDLRNQEEVGATVDQLFAALSAQHYEEVVLVNNAATLTPIKKVSALSVEDVLDNVSVNLASSLLVMQLYVKHFRMLNAKKSLMNISSGAALRGYFGWSLYCAGKAGCENFVNALAAEEETEENPFTVINFDPHVMDTEMQEEIRNSDIGHFPSKERFISYKESGRLRPPKDVALALVKLLQDPATQQTRYDIGNLEKEKEISNE